MPRTKTENVRVVDALGGSFDAMREAVRNEGRRGVRFSKRLVSEIEEGSKEVAALGRRLARDPADVAGLYDASIDLARRGFDHSADLVNELVTGARAVGTDVRESARKVIQANQAAAGAFGTAVRAGLTRRSSPVRKTAARRPAAKASRKRSPSRRKSASTRATRAKVPPGSSTG
jgi:hypothetical protein